MTPISEDKVLLCQKCQSRCSVEITPSTMFEGQWRVRFECTAQNCHLRFYSFLTEGERVPEVSTSGVMFSRNRNLKCEICGERTDILHPHTLEGDKDYLVCESCKLTCEEAEGLSANWKNLI
jgi:hypothetical protein